MAILAYFVGDLFELVSQLRVLSPILLQLHMLHRILAIKLFVAVLGIKRQSEKGKKARISCLFEACFKSFFPILTCTSSEMKELISQMLATGWRV